MWIWIRAHAVPFYGTFWTLRGMQEFEIMFGRKPFSELDTELVSEDSIKEAVGSAIRSSTIHFGEGRMNPSTIACVLHQVEEAIINRTNGSA